MTMTPEERIRAGRAVEQRIAERSATVVSVARAAGVDPKTLRALIRAERWPTVAVRAKLARALGWPPGEISRIATEAPATLDDFTDEEIVSELWRRLVSSREEAARRNGKRTASGGGNI